MSNYFLYARKSTDDKEHQVRSIEDQLDVLRLLAKSEGLHIVQEFTEKRSAKTLGRPVFNEMLEHIRKGEAQGIICWKLDRLARNPVDAAQVSWLLQEGVIEHIKTPEKSYYSKDSVLLMSVEFGMANQYIRDLSQNTSRGLRQKAKQGDFPGPAPVGYINNPKTKKVDVDKHLSPVIIKSFEKYAENKSRFEDIATYLYKHNIKTRSRSGSSGNRPWSKDRVRKMLTNSFYCGYFSYAGEVYEGNHTPIIPKHLFDKVQEVIKLRGRVQKVTKEPTALCRLIRCGSCGCSITAEVKTKYQKNGNVHHYTYYRCTKKRGVCTESYVREEILVEQLSAALSRFSLPHTWAEELLSLMAEAEQEANQTIGAYVQELRTKISDLDMRASRLTDLYVDQDIDRQTYLERKRSLMSDKKSAEEQIVRLKQNATLWLEPMREWVKEASMLDEIANTPDLPSKKISLQKIFGSNLYLRNQKIEFTPTTPYASLCEARSNFSGNDLRSYLVHH